MQICESHLLIIAGIKSAARQNILGGEELSPQDTGFAAYRATVDVEKMRADPDIAWIVEQPNINLW